MWSSAQTDRQTTAARELSGGRPAVRRSLIRGTGRLGAAGARALEALSGGGGWEQAATGVVHCRWGKIEIRGNGGARRGRALLERAASPSRVALPAVRGAVAAGGKGGGRQGAAGEHVLQDEAMREVRVERAVRVRGWVHVHARRSRLAPVPPPRGGGRAVSSV
jgi:hypothetical protein